VWICWLKWVYLCMCWCKQRTETGAKVVRLRLTACWRITLACRLISIQLQCCRRLHLRSSLPSLTAAAPSPVLVRSWAFNNTIIHVIRLPSNLRSTTCECVHLVMYGHCRLHRLICHSRKPCATCKPFGSICYRNGFMVDLSHNYLFHMQMSGIILLAARPI